MTCGQHNCQENRTVRSNMARNNQANFTSHQPLLWSMRKISCACLLSLMSDDSYRLNSWIGFSAITSQPPNQCMQVLLPINPLMYSGPSLRIHNSKYYMDNRSSKPLRNEKGEQKSYVYYKYYHNTCVTIMTTAALLIVLNPQAIKGHFREQPARNLVFPLATLL